MFPVLAGSNPSGYNLTRSLRLRSSASAYLNRTPVSAGNRKTFTWSGWVKRGALGINGTLFANGNGVNANGYFTFRFNTDNTVSIFNDNDGTLTTCDWSFTNVFRDAAAWYHLILAIDTTQATQNNRLKLYVNGVENTNRSVTTYPSQNSDLNINRTVPHQIGQFGFGSNQYFDGYLTEVNFIDGQALTPSSFGSTNTLTGVWQPARYTGTYGTNGFYLPFTDNSGATATTIGKDFSGNGNNWTPNNISVTAGVTYDSMTDVPTLTSATAANFAVLNPLDTGGTAPTNGNLTLTAGAAERGVRSTIQIPTTGLFYAEAVIGTSQSGSTDIAFGVVSSTVNLAANPYNVSNAWIIYGSSSTYITRNGSSTLAGAGSALVSGDVVQIAIDLANNKGWVGKNNTWFNSSTGTDGNPSTGTNPTFTFSSPPSLFPYAHGYSSTIDANFGQRPFAYTPPTGFVALNTYNLPTSTIVKGNTVMDATLYTGTNATLSVTNAASFKPDLVWVKTRSVVSRNTLFDSVRGNTKVLWSDSTDAEGTATGGTGLTAFSSNGFTLGTEIAGTSGSTNSNGVTYVGWQWQAGQGTTSTNTSGSITSTVSVNASAGFSIVTYTGSSPSGTVGHGLGVAPSMIIVKQRSSSGNSWPVWFKGATSATQYLYLNGTNAIQTSTNYWNSTLPTSSVFSVGDDSATNTTGSTYVAYCWTPIAGYSAFGSYTGNGSADGTFVYTGFRPKFVLVKRTDTTADWVLYDTSRNPYNLTNLALFPNGNYAESTATVSIMDIVSNGFKCRGTGAEVNASGGTYIYACFSENPFKNALAR